MSVFVNGRYTEVIDFHVHTFPDKIAAGAVGKLQQISGIRPSSNGTVSDTLHLMDIIHVDRSVLLNIATAPKQQTAINNCAKELMGEMGERFIPFGSVHFEAEDALTELERIKAMGLYGIKLHPDYQSFLIDDEQLFPIYEKCEELDLPIVFHAGWDCYSPKLVHAPPEASKKVIRRFPKLRIVLAHFGGLKMWDEVERHLIGEHVWFDTAMCASLADPVQMARMIQAHGAERVMLGSDCPWENPARSIDFIMGLKISDGEKEWVFSRSARTFLGI